MRLNQRIAALRRRDDSGAALVLALIFVTIVAVAIASLLAFADTSLRTTVALRSQASQSSGADGAAQVAIDQLRLGNYAGSGNCFGSTSTLTLTNFYQPAGGGAADSAAVTCGLDSVSSSGGSQSLPQPTYSILTLGNAKSTGKNPAYLENGISLNNNNMGQVNVQGNVASKSNITVMKKGSLNVQSGNATAADCSGSGTVVVTGGTLFCPDQAKADALTDPNYPAPAAPAAGLPTDPAPTGCGTTVVAVWPGIYDTPPDLSCSSALIFDFRPGVYYFNFTSGKHVDPIWVINTNAKIIAGAHDQITPTTPAARTQIPGACANGTGTDGNGVIFAFGGDSQMQINSDAKIELCGQQTSPTTPAISIYGLKSTLGAIPAPGSGSCVITPGGCSLLSINSTDNSLLYAWGAVYTPSASMSLSVKKDGQLFLNDGVVLRALGINSPGSATIPSPILQLSAPPPSPMTTVVYLTVYVCPGQGSCSPTPSAIRLRVKVGIYDPSGKAQPPSRQITVYSWSVQR